MVGRFLSLGARCRTPAGDEEVMVLPTAPDEAGWENNAMLVPQAKNCILRAHIPTQGQNRGGERTMKGEDRRVEGERVETVVNSPIF